MEKGVFKIQKVKKRSAEMQTADTLREAILSGAIPLGARLTEIGAAEQIGVSRTTIRTAFHQLVQEGLIIQTPYTGWSVMTLSAQDAWELYTLRASLEALASRLVAAQVLEERPDGATRKQVIAAAKALHDACAEGGKRVIAATDMALHRTIIELSHHSRLVDQYARIQHQISIYIQSSDALASSPEEIVRQHAGLIAAIETGDPEGAMQAAMLHNETEGAVLVAHLEQQALARA